MRPQTYITATIGTATLIVAGAELARGRAPRLRIFIGGIAAAFILTVAAGPVPGLARGIATLAILGAVLTSGYSLIRPLLAILNS